MLGIRMAIYISYFTFTTTLWGSPHFTEENPLVIQLPQLNKYLQIIKSPGILILQYSGSFRLVKEPGLLDLPEEELQKAVFHNQHCLTLSLGQAEAMLSQTVFQEQPDPNCQQPLLSTPPPKKANWGQTEKSLTTWYNLWCRNQNLCWSRAWMHLQSRHHKAQEKDWWAERIIDSLEAGQLTPFI